jgi:endothelin-converting enzyme/putative endopeptidase
MTPIRIAMSLLLGAAAGAAQTAPRWSAAHIDKTVSPCVDFYQYACGNWLAANPAPPDQPRWSRMSEVAEYNRLALREILEKAAAGGEGRPAIEQKIGDYYAACMDERGIEERGTSPLRPELERIAAVKDRAGFAEVLARLHRLGTSALFRFGAASDMKNSGMMIAMLDQAGISLPDRDYYLKDDARSAALRKGYTEHVARVFELLGDGAADAAAKARTVMELETGLASASTDRVARRDPNKRYFKLTRLELGSLAPELAWDVYFKAAGAPGFETLNVAAPPFVRGLDQLLHDTPLDKWKVYLTWHFVHANMESLPAAFVKANFEFFERALSGAREMRPRWKRCVAAADADLGEALGQKYVERHFGADGKDRTLKMVEALTRALEKDIQELAWMTPATRKQALVKLSAVTNKIGYPDKWRDYSALDVKRGEALGNSLRANEFQWTRRVVEKIGAPTDPKEWGMTPPTVNAYYSPPQNNINFPAGILQPPFFDRAMDDAVNFGAIGAVVGHELTHGFDDQGRKFDAQGNLKDWWTADDAREFEKRAECFARQYSEYEAAPGTKLNGKLTLGENTADAGGVRIAYMALLATLAGKPATKIDGFTPEQRFFLGWGQVWCTNQQEESARRQALTDPHSTGRWRVNGVVSNMPEFHKAFGCTAGQPMVRPQACRVW